VRSIWDILGIAATGETAAIRRAYARRLKATQPEDDPEGFKQLRAAYEAALQTASHADDVIQQVSAHMRGASAANHSEPGQSQLIEREAEPPEAELLQLQQAFHELARELRAAPTVTRAGHKGLEELEGLRAILQSPALANIQLEQQVETQLAELLARTLPRSDPLLWLTAQRFGWRKDAHRLSSAPAAIVARLQDLEFLASLEAPGSPYAVAFQRLQRPPVPVLSWLQAHVHRPPRAGGHQLLALLRDQHPALLEMLDARAVTWWDRLLSQPQPSLLLITLGVILTGFSMLTYGFVPDTEHSGGWPLLITAAAWAGVVLWKLYLIDWPRLLMQRRWPLGTPLVLKVGWLPLAASSLLLAALPIGERQWVRVAPVVLSLLALQWTWITVRPIAFGRFSDLNVGTLLVVLGPAALALFWWLAVAKDFSPPVYTQLMIPQAILLLACAFGLWETQAAWVFDLRSSQRQAALLFLALWCCAAGAAWWWLAPAAEWQPLSAALLLIALCLQRPLHVTHRQTLCLVGWWVLGPILYCAFLDEPSLRLRSQPLAGSGLVLLSAVLLTVICAWHNERAGIINRLARGG
jgi:hypothetical protein